MRRLLVYMNDKRAGVLTEQIPGKGYTFRYVKTYLSSAYPAISVTLPKRKEVYESGSLFPFFTNILPEGANRRAICRLLKIDESDLFGLLDAMADMDFIGAVHVKKDTDGVN